MAVRRKSQQIPARVAAYVVLVGFGAFVVFPFVYALAASLKDATDIFRSPPTVLPRRQKTAVIDGKTAPLYRVEVDGKTRTYALVETGLDIGLFVPPATPDAAPVEKRPVDVTPVGGFVNQKKVVFKGKELPLFLVDADGAGPLPAVEMVQVGRSGRGRFVDPEGKGPPVLANPRTSAPVEYLHARTQNYSDVLKLQNVDRSLYNTALVTILVVLGTVITSIMGGYAFSRLRFKGRDQIFLGYLATIMVPFVLLIIPLFKLMVILGWVNHLSSLILPFVFSAYGTFLMRQFFLTIPRELDEAAVIDGASHSQILWRILVPLCWPAIATLATFTFLYAWNSFIWPLAAVSANESNHVLTLSLQQLGGRAADKPHLVFAAVSMAVAVPIVVFAFFQRSFVENSAQTGIK